MGEIVRNVVEILCNNQMKNADGTWKVTIPTNLS